MRTETHARPMCTGRHAEGMYAAHRRRDAVEMRAGYEGYEVHREHPDYFVLSAITGWENADVNATNTFPTKYVWQLRKPAG
ncbi:MAG: hypothetical protein EF813_02020 [Methanosarcinales archaeon]|nr:MAG: hypothetical protein EF813_02020 [Methanosarcinales archaeon]